MCFAKMNAYNEDLQFRKPEKVLSTIKHIQGNSTMNVMASSAHHFHANKSVERWGIIYDSPSTMTTKFAGIVVRASGWLLYH